MTDHEKRLQKALDAHHHAMAIDADEKCPCCGEDGVADKEHGYAQPPGKGYGDVMNENEGPISERTRKARMLWAQCEVLVVVMTEHPESDNLHPVQVIEEALADGTMMALSDEIAVINREKGWTRPGPEDWADNHMIPAKLALIHSEVSEALEAFREDSQEGFEEELADIIIRTIDLAHGMGINIDYRVRAKIEKNRDREFRHGGKRI